MKFYILAALLLLSAFAMTQEGEVSSNQETARQTKQECSKGSHQLGVKATAEDQSGYEATWGSIDEDGVLNFSFEDGLITGSFTGYNSQDQQKSITWEHDGIGVSGGGSNEIDVGDYIIMEFTISAPYVFTGATVGFDSFYSSFNERNRATGEFEAYFNGLKTASGSKSADINNSDGDNIENTANVEIDNAFNSAKFWVNSPNGIDANYVIRYILLNYDSCFDKQELCSNQEYFDEETNKCLRCDQQCATCNKAGSCLTCRDTYNDRRPPHCECPEGHIDVNGSCVQINLCVSARYHTELSDECVVCNYYCEDCRTAEYFTDDLYEDVAEGCQKHCSPCSAHDKPVPVCVECPTKCDECTTSCTDCKDPNRTVENECECEDGTFDSAGRLCNTCKPECKTCTDYGYCTECQDPSRDLPHCLCPDGQWDNEGTCTNCNDDCATCENQEECVTCVDPAKILPLCTCPPGTYLEAETNKCQPCSPQCVTCVDRADKCIECVDKTRSAPDCSCPDGKYDKEGKQCDVCEDRCSLCNKKPDCDACKNSKGGRGPAPECLCPQTPFPTYDDRGNDCIPCPNQCSVCHENYPNCDSCKDSTRTPPACECGDREWDNKGESCESCLPVCATCSNGKECDTCLDSENRSPPQCECYAGYWDNNGKCEQCMKECKTCENGNSCTSCIDPENRSTPLCKCNVGYYDNAGVCEPLEECSVMEFHGFNNDCVSCKIKCKSCPENDKCTPSCQGQCTQQDMEENTICKALGCEVFCDNNCDEDQYCEDCQPQCLNCYQKEECNECKSSSRSLPQCLCEAGQFDPDVGYDTEGTECLPCHESCATCNGYYDNNCLSCPEGSSLNANNQCAPTAGFLQQEKKIHHKKHAQKE